MTENIAHQDSHVIEAHGEVTHPPGTLIATVLIPVELDLALKAAVIDATKGLVVFGALVEFKEVT